MEDQNYGLLENYKDLGVGIVEFALDDYISTVKSLMHYYRKLDNSLNEHLGRQRKYHERCGDVCRDIYRRINNLNEIERFLTGEYVQKLTTLDAEGLFKKAKQILKQKGYKVKLMSLIVTSDDKGVRIFANEKEGANGKYTLYSIGISSKNSDGTWLNGYLNCRFKKGVSVPNKAKIKINSAFFCNSKSGSKVYTSLMITDFEILEGGDSAAGDADSFMKIPDNIDDEAPFL